MTIKATVHPLEAERLATGRVPEGWHSGMVRVDETIDYSKAPKMHLADMPGGRDDPYDAYIDEKTTRGLWRPR